MSNPTPNPFRKTMTQGTDAGPEWHLHMCRLVSLYMRAHICTYAVMYRQHEGAWWRIWQMGSRHGHVSSPHGMLFFSCSNWLLIISLRVHTGTTTLIMSHHYPGNTSPRHRMGGSVSSHKLYIHYQHQRWQTRNGVWDANASRALGCSRFFYFFCLPTLNNNNLWSDCLYRNRDCHNDEGTTGMTARAWDAPGMFFLFYFSFIIVSAALLGCFCARNVMAFVHTVVVLIIATDW